MFLGQAALHTSVCQFAAAGEETKELMHVRLCQV